MHEQAEYGIAAHWLYKKSGGSSASKTNDAQRLDDQINWLKHSLDWAASDEITDAKEYLHSLKVDLFDQEIFVFTPKGEVMALRAGSTPLDFAYAVHTEVGNHCVGAKINGAVAPLTHEIKTGDRVEILTNKSSKPSRDWLKIVKTPSAKSKIRRYFAAATKDDDAAAGRDMLAKDLRKRGYGISTPRSTRALNAVAEQFNFKQLEDLFAAVGAGKVAPRAVGNKVEQILDPKPEEQLTKAEAIAEVVKQPARGSNRKPQKRGKSASNGIIVKGESNSGLLVRLAHCCNPVTGDDIVGFITRGRGVSVHRANCPNVKGLMEHPERMIDVEWDALPTPSSRSRSWSSAWTAWACSRMSPLPLAMRAAISFLPPHRPTARVLQPCASWSRSRTRAVWIRCWLPSAVSIRSTTLAVLCPAKAELSSNAVCRCESLSAS